MHVRDVGGDVPSAGPKRVAVALALAAASTAAAAAACSDALWNRQLAEKNVKEVIAAVASARPLEGVGDATLATVAALSAFALGGRRVVSALQLVAAITVAFLGVRTSIAGEMLERVGTGLAASGVVLVSLLVVTETRLRPGLTLGIAAGASALGTKVGSELAVSKHSLHAIGAALAAFTALSAIASFFLLRSDGEAPLRRVGYREAVEPQDATQPSSHRSLRAALRRVWTRRAAIAMACIALLHAVVNELWPRQSDLLFERARLRTGGADVLVRELHRVGSWGPALLAIALPSAGALHDRLRRKPALLGAIAVVSAVTIVWSLSPLKVREDTPVVGYVVATTVCARCALFLATGPVALAVAGRSGVLVAAAGAVIGAAISYPFEPSDPIGFTWQTLSLFAAAGAVAALLVIVTRAKVSAPQETTS